MAAVEVCALFLCYFHFCFVLRNLLVWFVRNALAFLYIFLSRSSREGTATPTDIGSGKIKKVDVNA